MDEWRNERCAVKRQNERIALIVIKSKGVTQWVENVRDFGVGAEEKDELQKLSKEITSLIKRLNTDDKKGENRDETI